MKLEQIQANPILYSMVANLTGQGHVQFNVMEQQCDRTGRQCIQSFKKLNEDPKLTA